MILNFVSGLFASGQIDRGPGAPPYAGLRVPQDIFRPVDGVDGFLYSFVRSEVTLFRNYNNTQP